MSRPRSRILEHLRHNPDALAALARQGMAPINPLFDAAEGRAFVIFICPECLQQQGEVSVTHTGDCPNRGKTFAYRTIEVVPVRDVADWMDETYGTPDSNRFLDQFSVIEKRQR